MKRTVRSFVTLLLIAFLTFVSVSVVWAQATPSAQPMPSGSQATGAAVKLEGETLFVLQLPLGGLSVQERAQRTSRRVLDFATDQTIPLDQLELYTADKDGIPLTVINAGSNLLIALSDADAQRADKPRSELAQEYFQIIQQAVSHYRQERSLQYLLTAAGRSAIATLALIGVLLITNNTFARFYRRIQIWKESYIHPVRLGNWELIQANQLDDLITWLLRLAQAVLILGLLVAYFAFVLEQFPWTKGLANLLKRHVIITFETGWLAFIRYLPSLLTIILVVVVTQFLLSLSKPFFRELGEARFMLPGFYPEWADATHKLFTVLVMALAAVIIFPLLPGFQSPAFQGISVFLGLLISLGSTSVISNLISGSVLIYTRAFRVGDRIKIGEISGKVLETTLLVTRILTPTNVIVSIPNSQISTSSIENLSFSYRELNQPLIVRTAVYLGYEVPWRNAYQALIRAALMTQGIANAPEPFVLQGELNEVYVTYLLNVYVDVEYFINKGLKEIEMARSQLNENIRDCCAEAGIQIFAPSYEADPTNYGPAAER